jgi:hypothetical protein
MLAKHNDTNIPTMMEPLTGKIQRNIKTYNTFLVQALINHIMVSILSPNCPTLPDGRVLTAALVGMDKDGFNSMFLDGIQVRCASGSSCNVHAGADSVEKSPHHCINCTLKFHVCIICSGSRRLVFGRRRPAQMQAHTARTIADEVSQFFRLVMVGGGVAAEGGGAETKKSPDFFRDKKVPRLFFCSRNNITLGEEGTDPSILTKGMFSMYQRNLQICL